MELIVDAVSKRYREDAWAVRDVSLRVGPGVIGLLGPNGAGKSTLMRILAAAKGLGARAARARTDEVIQLVNLADAARAPIGGFSGGMRQRVGIAQALLNDPQLLIVDEPTVGLDPSERLRFRNLLADLAGERIVMLSTHIVTDVEEAATSIALIQRGRLLRHALPEDLLRDVAGKVWTWAVPSDELVATRARFAVSATTRRADGVLVRVVSDGAPVPAAEPAAATLEDAYHHAVGAGAALAR